MLSFEPNIIFVDDKPEEVLELVEMYRNEGIGCRFFNADLIDGDNYPKAPYSDINLIFLDLYYKDNFDVELCTGWVESVIPENSFYVLVIWSKDTENHSEEIETDLIKMKRKPYVTFEFQKGEKYKNEDGSWNVEKLYCDIDDKVKECHPLEELGLWKKSIKNSSNKIIGHLSKDLDDALEKKLQKIILAHGGTTYIESENHNAQRDVLFEALDNVLISNSKASRPSLDVSKDNKESLYNISKAIQTKVDPKLNSWFHFNLYENFADTEMIVSGLIAKNKDATLQQMYSIKDDPKVEPKLKDQIENDGTEIEDIVVVLTRPCDIAQNKYGKNIKLLSGLKIKKPARYTEEEAIGKKKRYLNQMKFCFDVLPDSCKLYERLCFDGSEVAIIFDYRYSFSVPKTVFCDENKFKNEKIFNKELLSELQVEYGAYSSRLGITQVI